MTRTKRPILSLIISGVLFIASGAVVWLMSPTPVLEVILNMSVVTAFFLLTSWFFNSAKRGALISLGLWGLILMSRLSILGFLPAGLWIILVGVAWIIIV